MLPTLNSVKFTLFAVSQFNLIKYLPKMLLTLNTVKFTVFDSQFNFKKNVKI